MQILLSGWTDPDRTMELISCRLNLIEQLRRAGGPPPANARPRQHRLREGRPNAGGLHHPGTSASRVGDVMKSTGSRGLVASDQLGLILHPPGRFICSLNTVHQPRRAAGAVPGQRRLLRGGGRQRHHGLTPVAARHSKPQPARAVGRRPAAEAPLARSRAGAGGAIGAKRSVWLEKQRRQPQQQQLEQRRLGGWRDAAAGGATIGAANGPVVIVIALLHVAVVHAGEWERRGGGGNWRAAAAEGQGRGGRKSSGAAHGDGRDSVVGAVARAPHQRVMATRGYTA